MRILIYGAGAVGCYIGGQLALAGHSVSLLGRDRMTRAVQKRGLTIESPNEATSTPTVQAGSSLSDLLRVTPRFDLILFTMKAYDTLAAAQELSAAIPQPSPIVCFQNGVGNEETLNSVFGDQSIVAATLTTPVSMNEPGVVIAEKPGAISLASDSPAFAVARAAFAPTRLQTSVVSNSHSLKWSKLLLNTICNATSAVLDLSPQEIVGNRRLFNIEMAVLRETLAVLRLSGINLVDLPGFRVKLLAFLASQLPTFLLRPLIGKRISSGRGEKPSSLLLALRDRQTRTEIAWLNGATVQEARKHERRAPLNHGLALLVSDIASRRVPWEMYRHKPEMLISALHAADGLKGWRYGE